MTIPPSLAQPSFVQAPIETTDPNAISKTIMDAKGDLISATGADTPARLAVGSDGQVLLADSTQATGLRWAADPTTTSFDAKGDLLVGTGPDAYTRVPVGTNNQVLVADSAEASGVRWSSEQDPNAITKSIIDAKGDLIAGTAADTPARLAVGSDGQYLIADSTQTAGIKWATPNITLGTETTGNYVAGITGGTGVTVTGSGSEGATPSVAIGQAVGTGDTVAFGGLNVDSGTLYVDATNNRVGINDTTPSYSLDVTGDGHFSTDLTVDGTVYANHIHGEIAGPVYIHVKNTTASTIPNGTPVYITGTVGSTQVAEIAPADASNAAKMPAIGITDGDMIANATGHVVILGALDGQDTSGTWQLGDHVYVASGGGRTRTRPTGVSDIIQCVGHVGRLNANTGEIIVNAGSVVSAPNTISIPGNITTTAGQFNGSGAGLTSIPAGQLSGTVPSSNIGNDTVALGTKTTGDYVATLQAGTGVTVTNGSGEGVSPTVAIGQAVGIADSPQFQALTTTGTASLNAVTVTNGVGAASATITGTTATSVLTVDGIEIDTTGASANQVLAYNGTKFAPSTPGAADANALTGTTLASNVVNSSLTSVGTLTSLAVTGDLTVDTNVLKVDTTNNRVGINVTSPTSVLDLVGNMVVREAATQDGIQLAGRAGGTGSATVKLIPDVLTLNRTLTLPDETGTVALTSLVPAGCIMQYGGSSAPSGWLLCDGTAVLRSTYSTLFAIIGTTYGPGNGFSTFNIPDLRTRVAVGKAASGTFATLGTTGGQETVVLTSAQSGVPAHSHGITDPGHTHTYNQWVFFVQSQLVNGYNTSSNTGALFSTPSTNSQTTGITVNNNTAANAASAHTNLQPYIVLNYIIKT